jgi:hypothetical protein
MIAKVIDDHLTQSVGRMCDVDVLVLEALEIGDCGAIEIFAMYSPYRTGTCVKKVSPRG